MSINTLQRIAKIVISMSILLAMTACAINKPFNPIDGKRAFKHTSIAVISGSHRDQDVKLAEVITKELAKRSTFRVLSQEEIEKHIPNYPSVISIRANVKDDDEKATWFQPSEKQSLDAMQAKLRVDYLYVIWNSQMTLVTSRNGSTYYVYPVGNMIEYPGARVVASTRSVNGSSTSILALFRPADYYIVDALNGAAENIVDEFLDVTKSEKP